MADWPLYSVKDLSRYSGRSEASYPDFADEALSQALFLFQIASALEYFPDPPRDAQLVRLGLLSMADLLVLSQPHQAAIATPFQSESIGSYSYSKAQNKVAQGLPTGVSWFDMAVGRLGIGVDNLIESEATTVFEHDYPSRVVSGRRTVATLRRQQLLPDPSTVGFSSDATGPAGTLGDGNYGDVGLLVGYAQGGLLVGASPPPVPYGAGLYVTSVAVLTVPAAVYPLPFDTPEVLGDGGVLFDGTTVTINATGLYLVAFDVLFLPDEEVAATVSLALLVDPPVDQYPAFPGGLPSVDRVDSEARSSVEGLLYAGTRLQLQIDPAAELTVIFAELTVQRIG